MEQGGLNCGVCGQPVSAAQAQTAPPPRDYIPYCRSCGVGVAWGAGHTCRRCGVSPLCDLHFRPADGLCLDCGDARLHSAPAPAGYGVADGLTCRACGAAVFPDADFCPNCGQSVSAIPHGAVEYMGFWIRIAAFLVDRIIVYVVAAIIAAVIGISRTSGEVDPIAQEDITISLATINYSFLLLIWGLSVFYGVVFTALRGQTPGKMLLRIQVVDANGNIPPWYRVIARELVGRFLAEALVWMGYVWIGFDPRKRGWHDYLGGSFVVRKQRGARPPGGIF